jgi:hypothetical protein
MFICLQYMNMSVNVQYSRCITFFFYLELFTIFNFNLNEVEVKRNIRTYFYHCTGYPTKYRILETSGYPVNYNNSVRTGTISFKKVVLVPVILGRQNLVSL